MALSALPWRGAPYWLLEAIRQRGDVPLISSATLLEELAYVLTRPSAAKRLAVIGKTAQVALADYVEIVAVVAPAEVPRVVPADADDDHVIATAVAGGAEFIVSGDSDLLGIGIHWGIGTVSAPEAVERLEGQKARLDPETEAVERPEGKKQDLTPRPTQRGFSGRRKEQRFDIWSIEEPAGPAPRPAQSK